MHAYIYVHICIHTKVYIYTLLTVLLRYKKNDFLFSNLGDYMFILFSQLLLSLLSFSLAVKKHPNHRGKGLFHLTTPTPWSQSIVEGSWVRNSRQVVEDRNWSRGHRGVLLTGLLPIISSTCFLYTTQVHLPKGGTVHSELGLTHQSLIKKCPRHTGHSHGGSWVLSSQVAQVCVKFSQINTLKSISSCWSLEFLDIVLADISLEAYCVWKY